jgi:DNA polymerase III subunit delta'
MNKFDGFLLHSSTHKRIKDFLEYPAHGVLISGEAGSGKKTIAKALGSELLDLKTELDSYPHLYHLKRPEGKQDIPIEDVRKVINSLQLKVPGKNKINKLVIIEDANYLSIPAQNALLKSLEEPSIDTVFILTSDSSSNLLPTIISRVQEIKINPVSLDQAIKYWHDKHDETVIRSSWQLSQGAPGLLNVLLDGANHPLKNSVIDAKKFLGSSVYNRLLTVDQISKNKENYKNFLNALNKILRALQLNAINSDKKQQSKNILDSRKAVLESLVSIEKNSNVKLTAMSLVLNLKI